MHVTIKLLFLSTLAALASTLGAEKPTDDSEIDKRIEEMTATTYQATSSKDKGDTAEGWPKELAGLKIRFIRLDHGGQGWDDGMAEPSAEVNLMQALAKTVGLDKVAQLGESHSIALLAKYPADVIPPFVYLTGNGAMGRVRQADSEILRQYCLKGGMLIADAGSKDFHASFLQFMHQVFPDRKLVEIAADDVIYQIPNLLSDGAPPLWHHGGNKPLGIKEGDRWIVFYHPGDMNDTWKSPDLTEATPEMRKAGMELGINLLCYAFSHWFTSVTKGEKTQPTGDPAITPALVPDASPKP
jgi:Domain of unknown function (DUF4159)